MTKLAAYLTYRFLYLLVYMIPFALFFLVPQLLTWLHVDAGRNIISILRYAAGIVGVIGLYVAHLRTKYAVDLYDGTEYTFWRAHYYSGAMLNAELAFLPIIGRFFRGGQEDE